MSELKSVPDFDLRILGNNIKKRRLARRLTREDFAQIVEITPDHLNKVERGERGVSIEVLFRLAYILNMSIDALITPDLSDDERCLKDLTYTVAAHSAKLQTAMAHTKIMQKTAEKSVLFSAGETRQH